MKEVIGKSKLVNDSLPKHLILNNRNVFYQKTIANSSNEYFVSAGPKIANTSVAEIIWNESERIWLLFWRSNLV